MNRRTPRRRQSAPSVAVSSTADDPPLLYVMKTTRLQDAIGDAHGTHDASTGSRTFSQRDASHLDPVSQCMASAIVSSPRSLPPDQGPLAHAAIASQVAAFEMHFHHLQTEEIESLQRTMQTELDAVLSSSSSSSVPRMRSISRSTSGANAWYVLGKVIGSGTFGRVQLATHRVSHARVAIKSYFREKGAHVCCSPPPRPPLASRPQRTHQTPRPAKVSAGETDALEWKRVRQEAALLASLHAHTGLVTFIEAFETPTQLQIVTELVAGGSLYDLLTKQPHQRLSECEARRIFVQLCAAVRALHDQHVIHRDLKLENVLLDDHGHARLIDFGFSQREYDAADASSTGTNLVCLPTARSVKNFCGTPSYMAPEVVACKTYDGKRVDVWSLGVLLYIMLCGKFPFQAATLHQLYQTIRATPLVFSASVSKDAQHVVRSLLIVDPLQRATLAAIENHAWMTRGGSNNHDAGVTREHLLEAFMGWEIGVAMIGETLARLYGLDASKVSALVRGCGRSSNSLAALVRLTMLSAEQQLSLALEAASAQDDRPMKTPIAETVLVTTKKKATRSTRQPQPTPPPTDRRLHRRQPEHLVGLVQ